MDSKESELVTCYVQRTSDITIVDFYTCFTVTFSEHMHCTFLIQSPTSSSAQTQLLRKNTEFNNLKKKT